MMDREWRVKYWRGFNWRPYTPYTVTKVVRRQQGLCNANDAHSPAMDGQWVFGATVCGKCGMYFNEWPEERCIKAAEMINRLPPDQQQRAAAALSSDLKGNNE